MVDVALSRAEVRRAEVAVVLDVLRATSTIVWALSAGYDRVLCADSLQGALAQAGPDRVLAGEREWVRAPGFDLGNSPAQTQTQAPRGRELVLATTNGTATVVCAARAADTVLIGSLANLEAVLAAVADAEDVQVICAGTRLRPALEDVYVAGRIAARLGGPQTDAAQVARAVADRFASPLAALESGTGAGELRARGLGADVAWCAREACVDLAPQVRAVEEGVAVVDLGSGVRGQVSGTAQGAAVSRTGGLSA